MGKVRDEECRIFLGWASSEGGSRGIVSLFARLSRIRVHVLKNFFSFFFSLFLVVATSSPLRCTIVDPLPVPPRHPLTHLGYSYYCLSSISLVLRAYSAERRYRRVYTRPIGSG